MRNAILACGLLAACGGRAGTTAGTTTTPGTTPPPVGGGNACGAAREEGVVGLWRLDSATCGGEAMPAMVAPAFEEEIEVSVAWPAYSTIAHTFVRRNEKYCRYRVDRRVEPGGSPQRVVETGRWAELAGATGWAPASTTDCPNLPEAALDGELKVEAESLVFTIQGPTFCPGKPWVFKYRRIPCAAQ